MSLLPPIIMQVNDEEEDSFQIEEKCEKLGSLINSVSDSGRAETEELLKNWDFTDNPFEIISLWLLTIQKYDSLVAHLPIITTALAKGGFDELDDVDVSNAVFALSIMDFSDARVSAAFKELIRLISSYQGELEQDAIVRCMGSLSSLDASSPGALEAVALFTDLLQDCDEKFTSSDVSTMIFGLQSMSDEHKEVRGAIAALTEVIRESVGAYDSDVLRIAFTVLPNWDSNNREVKTLCEALAIRVGHANCSLKPDALGAMIGAFSNLDCRNPAVIQLLSAVNKLFSQQTRNSLKLSLQDFEAALQCVRSVRQNEKAVPLLGIAASLCYANQHHMLGLTSVSELLCSLGGQSAHVVEVRDFMRGMCTFLEASGEVPTPLQISGVMNGMCGMTEELPEVRTMLVTVKSLLDQCDEPFSGTDVAHSLYGLKMMSLQAKEVEGLVAAFTTKISLRTGIPPPSATFSGEEIGRALTGTLRMDTKSPTCRRLLGALVPRIVFCKDPKNEHLDEAINISCVWDEDIKEVSQVQHALKILMKRASR